MEIKNILINYNNNYSVYFKGTQFLDKNGEIGY